MPAADTGAFTIGVFQDATWARTGIEALLRIGLTREALSVIARDSPEVRGLVASLLGAAAPPPRELPQVGAAVAVGPLVGALDGGARDLERLGLAGTMRRAGFQEHDGRIYEALTIRGGVLVAVHSEPRAADALSIFLSFGGGNAAIGAWTGRL